jgi:peptidoglycan/LPS O-acetylase OafA/YrhL
MASFKYRTDIDGLRALSVLLVILFHMNGIVSGGYIGVDVFFVISGFLITSLLLREINEGKFSFQNFWIRRIRRILPASLVCILGTMAIACVVMLPSDLVAAARSAMASALAVANVFFWRDGGYFAGPSDAKPFLHFWSLSVEEQFYLFYPILLFAVSRFRKISVFQILLFGAVGSFLLSVWGVANKPSATFFLLPTRAWELLLGGMLAAAPAIQVKQSARDFMSLAGLAMIVISAIVFSPQTPFPGFAALLPCLGAVCFIQGNSGDRPTIGGSLLSMKPIVFVGLISYSLYLWHWPVLAFMRYMLIELNLFSGAIALPLIFILATLSWRFVEQPFRHAKPSSETPGEKRLDRRPLYYGFMSIAVACAFASALIYSDGWISRYGEKLRPFVEDATNLGRHMATPVGSRDYPRIGDLSARDQFAVWGDSHAMMMAETLDSVAKEAGVSGRFISVPGSPPLLDVYRNLGRTPPNPEVEKIVEFIVKNEISDVILIARWSAYVEGYSESDLIFEERGKSFDQFLIGDQNTEVFSPADAKRVLDSQLAKIIERFSNSGIKVWLIQQVPEQEGPTAFPLLMGKLGFSVRYYPTDFKAHEDRQRVTNKILKSMENIGATVVATQSLLFDEQKEPILFVDGRACYVDNDHLTLYGVRKFLGPPLGQLMREIALPDHAGVKQK